MATSPPPHDLWDRARRAAASARQLADEWVRAQAVRRADPDRYGPDDPPGRCADDRPRVVAIGVELAGLSEAISNHPQGCLFASFHVDRLDKLVWRIDSAMSHPDLAERATRAAQRHHLTYWLELTRAADSVEKELQRKGRSVPTGPVELPAAKKAEPTPQVTKGEAGPTSQSNAKGQSKRSTTRGEGRAKLIAALTKHHRYADGDCPNTDPVGNNQLAIAAGVAYSTASAFFRKEFKGWDRYRMLCLDSAKLVVALKMLNDEYSPHILYGGRPPGEGDRGDN